MDIHKYQVEHSYIFVESDRFLSDKEKELELEKLDKKDKEYKTIAAAFWGASIISFITATGLLINRKKIIKQKRKANGRNN
jgi:hypothetical protein